jgi:uncharacterized protein YidB (DUF937 family)
MGLFDTILGGIEAKDTQHAALYAEVGSLVNQAGGVSGLTQQFEQKGLGGVIAGWISNGPNPGISGDQIINVIGKDKVAAIAAKAGLTEDQVAAGVSKLLPLVVDHLTPNGTIPPHSPTDVNAALGSLKAKLLGS